MTELTIYIQSPLSRAIHKMAELTVQRGVGTLTYCPSYVAADGWVPDPLLYPLRAEPYSGIAKNRGLPGFVRDAAPDGWGELLVRREYGAHMDALGYLLKTPDHDRTGSLIIDSGAMLTKEVFNEIGILTHLDAFIDFVDVVQAKRFSEGYTAHTAMPRYLTALGGARPKCTLQDNDRLILAKPRDRHDLYDIPALEYACMTFAAGKGLKVAAVDLHSGRVNTLLVERFDRQPAENGRFCRVPMLSGLTLLDSDWNDPKDWNSKWHYGFLADEMARRGVPATDRQELFKRICFNVLVGNDDDHPKNVAIIFKDGRWRLSPMYDVLPTTEGGPPTHLAMGVGRYGKELSRRNLLSQVEHYGLTAAQGSKVIDEVMGWGPELIAHYRIHLQEPELGVALAAMRMGGLE